MSGHTGAAELAAGDPRLPGHVAIIMDGNGRWAKKRLLPRAAGHTAGMKRVKMAMTRSSELGIRYLTLYAFSTENWKRPKNEVSFLMNLVIEYMKKELDAMDELGIRVQTLGDIAMLPAPVIDILEKAQERTSANEGLRVNLALNYGSRAELVRAVRRIAEKTSAGLICPADVTEDLIGEHLGTAGQPDPDLLIRTSGEERLSNFLLWQLAYAELFFSPVLWPDFDQSCYDGALRSFMDRNRRFGGLGPERGTRESRIPS